MRETDRLTDRLTDWQRRRRLHTHFVFCLIFSCFLLLVYCWKLCFLIHIFPYFWINKMKDVCMYVMEERRITYYFALISMHNTPNLNQMSAFNALSLFSYTHTHTIYIYIYMLPFPFVRSILRKWQINRDITCMPRI